MKALSIRAPWWVWILYGGKDTENRDWPTKYRGPVLVHASKFWNPTEIGEDHLDATHMAGRKPSEIEAMAGLDWPEIKKLGGHIVGIVDIVDCVEQSDSPWFVGRYGFVLRNPRIVTPYPVKGKLGFFDAPEPPATGKQRAGRVPDG